MKHATKRKKGIVRRLNRKTNRKRIVGGDKIDNKLKLLLDQLKLEDIDKDKFKELFNGFCETLLIYIYDRDKKEYTIMNSVVKFHSDLKKYMDEDPKDASLIDKHIDNIIQVFKYTYLPYILKKYNDDNPSDNIADFGIGINNSVINKYKIAGYNLDTYFNNLEEEAAAAVETPVPAARAAAAQAAAEAAAEAAAAVETPVPAAEAGAAGAGAAGAAAGAKISSQDIMDLVNQLLVVNKAIDKYDPYTELVEKETKCSTSRFPAIMRVNSVKTVRQCTQSETNNVNYAKELIKQREQMVNVMNNLPKQVEKWIEQVQGINTSFNSLNNHNKV
jgi:hypothetical protein